MKTCPNCSQTFEITDQDLKFYESISPIFNGQKYKIPPPSLCPSCRQQRRLAWRNERNLYHRTCDATNAKILSVYSPDKPYLVYKNDYWHSDQWDGKKFNQDFDFNKPFFEQFNQLLLQVPQLARSAVGNQNCEFVNQCGWCKNCYLIFEADHNENCYYSGHIYDSRSSLDVLYGTNLELCYECLDCKNCYNSKFLQNCQECSDSWYLKNCLGCKNCFWCTNLHHKQYYIENQKYTQAEFEKKIQTLDLKTFSNLQKLRNQFINFTQSVPHKYLQGTQNENSTGNYLRNTQNCEHCYDLQNAQDCKFITDSRNTKKVYDMTVFGSIKGVEFCCENHEIGEGVRNIFYSDQIWSGGYNIFYSKLCINNCHDCFGCIGLKHNEYCVLNKSYSKEEYEKLIPRIIEHMQKTKEWGEFFPISISPVAYNETLAQEFYPLTQKTALKKGYKWKTPEKKNYHPQTYQIPDDIQKIPDSITNEILACIDCEKNYKIVTQELKFYRQTELPIPPKCPDCRHKVRSKLRTPRHLWTRQCQKCNLEIQTTYSPDRPEVVYCERCYLNNII